MPEGPSILILKEEAMQFAGKKVLQVGGNAKLDLTVLKNKKIIAFKSWGKHLLICFNNVTVRIHLMMFGSYLINERKETPPRLSLKFSNGELNFYTCSVKFIEGDLDEVYNWEADIMSPKWNAQKAVTTVKNENTALVCDILWDQNIFAGSGNIIKNEVLFITKIHPLTPANALPLRKIKEMVKETHDYSLRFYKWKKKLELSKHWLAYQQKTFPRCKIPFLLKHLGKTKRRTFYCDNCQVLYKSQKKASKRKSPSVK